MEESKALRRALIQAWVLLGRCDNVLDELDAGQLNAKGRRDLITKMRAQILHAMASAS